MANVRQIIACNIEKLLNNGDFVNLGVGIPTMVGNYVAEGKTLFLHGENGYFGQDQVLGGFLAPGIKAWAAEHCAEKGDWREGHTDLISASGEYINLIPGSACFDSSMSFALARGGCLDVTVLGGLQVDAKGNLANWMVPGGRMNGMGGAMDLVAGAKKVIIAMEHCSKQGDFKLLEECTMPLTGVHCVDTVVTEFAVIDIEDGKFVVKAMAPGITREELQAKTGAPLYYAEEVGEMEIPA